MRTSASERASVHPASSPRDYTRAFTSPATRAIARSGRDSIVSRTRGSHASRQSCKLNICRPRERAHACRKIAIFIVTSITPRETRPLKSLSDVLSLYGIADEKPSRRPLRLLLSSSSSFFFFFLMERLRLCFIGPPLALRRTTRWTVWDKLLFVRHSTDFRRRFLRRTVILFRLPACASRMIGSVR